MMFNKVFIGGNLTRDPELNHTTSGTAVCKVSIATNRKWTDANGSAKEDVYFCDAVAYGKTADVIAQHLRKGNPIFVVGRLKREEWEDKNTGVKKSATRIIIDEFRFVGGRREETQTPSAPRVTNPPSTEDSEVPF